MNGPTIATLPMGNAESPQKVTKNALNLVDYSDKSFIVFGEATRTYKEQMKQLGGKFNMRLQPRPGFPGGPAWIFQPGQKPAVIDFMNQVNTRKITHHEEVMHQDSPTTALGLPTVIGPITNTKYQSVHWRVFKPSEGMSVTVKAGGVVVAGKVLQVESHRNVVDTAYINVGGNTSKLVICNGYWQVWGYMVDHRVIFDNQVDQGNEQGTEAEFEPINEHVDI